MQKNIEEAINLLLNTLNKTFDDFHGLYLFGLFADGKDHKGEDIELVALFDSEDKYKREIIWPIVGKIETELDVYIDLNPTTMAELKKDEYLYEEVTKSGIFFDARGIKK